MASNAANMEHSLHCLRLPHFLGSTGQQEQTGNAVFSAFHATFFHYCFVKLALLQDKKAFN